MSPLPVTSNVPLDAKLPSPETAETAPVSVCTVAFPAVATGHCVFNIKDYSRLKLKSTHGENGSYIESSAFSVGGHSWKVRCYLNGDRKDAAGFVSLFLLRVCGDGDAAALATYQFGLVCHQGTPAAAAAGGRRGKRSTACTFGGKDDKAGGWGNPRFIRVKELEGSGFIKDDCFVVRCTVTVVEERTTAAEKVVVPAHEMERLMGVVCKCDDDTCKRQHARPAQSFLERVGGFFYSICRGPV